MNEVNFPSLTPLQKSFYEESIPAQEKSVVLEDTACSAEKALTSFSSFHPMHPHQLLFSSSVSFDKIERASSLHTLIPLCFHYLSSFQGPKLPIEQYVNFFRHIDLLSSSFEENDKLNLIKIAMKGTTHDCASGSPTALLFWSEQAKAILNSEAFSLLLSPTAFSEHDLLDTLIRAIYYCIELEEEECAYDVLLYDYSLQSRTLVQLVDQLEQEKQLLHLKKFPEKSLEDVLQDFSEKKHPVYFPLDQEELTVIGEKYRILEMERASLRSCTIDQLVSKVQLMQKQLLTPSFSLQEKLQLLAIGREVLEKELGITPYSTQMLAVLGLLNHSNTVKGRLAQLQTGEGKSLIIALLAFYFACQGRTVDIVFPSRYLATRDLKKYIRPFRRFFISSSHICTDTPEKDDFSGQILCGTYRDFAFSILRDALYGYQFRCSFEDRQKERPFDVVLVDEVDNLLIDDMLKSAYLSIEKKEKINWVYPLILSFIRKEESNKTSSSFTPLFKERTAIEKLQNQLKEYQKTTFSHSPILFPTEIIEEWVISAYKALYLFREGVDYILKQVDGKQSVVIIDTKNTGRRQENSRWQAGLHEFLEAKHHLTIREEGLTVASLFPSLFFRQYASLYGVTGSAGEKSEREEMRAIFEIESFDVPFHLPSLRKKWPYHLCASEFDFRNTLCEHILRMQRRERPVLVLFETVQQTLAFSSFLTYHNCIHQVLNDCQVEEEEFIIMRAGQPSTVTLATNVATRGTDILLHPLSRKKGGLHLILTFYPINDRVEIQAFGRTARQGIPGSYQMILSIETVRLKEEKTSFLKKNTEAQWKQLYQWRSLQTQSLSLQRQSYFNLEKIRHHYLHFFFKKLSIWFQEIDTAWIEELDATLRLYPQHYNDAAAISGMSGELVILRKQILLHYSTNKNTLSLLNQVKSLLLKTIRERWAYHFYDTIQKGETEPDYEHQLQKRYQNACQHWECYLHPPKEGFLLFFQEIMGKPFPNLNFD